MKESKTIQYKIERDIKISGENMYSRLNNLTLSTVESLDNLADYMNISMDYLLRRIQ